MTGLGVAGLVLLAAFLFGTVFLFWVGLSGGTPGANKYGPTPQLLVTVV